MADSSLIPPEFCYTELQSSYTSLFLVKLTAEQLYFQRSVESRLLLELLKPWLKFLISLLVMRKSKSPLYWHTYSDIQNIKRQGSYSPNNHFCLSVKVDYHDMPCVLQC